MRVKKYKCPDCKHPADDHSVYRPICLVKGCDCTQATLEARRQSFMLQGGLHV